MAHLIDKDALVAEIEKRITEGEKVVKEVPSSAIMGLIQAYKNTLSFINTLDVKEVDLEKYYHDFSQKEWFDKNCSRTMSEMMAFTAKHFFELGMQVSNKTQKGK